MTVYWLMFLIPLFGVLSPLRGTPNLNRLNWLMVGILLASLVGLRHEVGGDWLQYMEEYEDKLGTPFLEIFDRKEPGQAVLVWLSAVLGLGVYGTNVVSAVIFVAGLIFFCRRQPFPWLALAVAVPYLVVVVGMGYTRQSLALGLLFFALAELERGKQVRYLAIMVIALLFHYGALLLLPLGAVVGVRRGFFKTLAILAILAAGALTLLQAQLEFLYSGYIAQAIASEGGAIRVWMCAVAAVVFFATRRHWYARWEDTQIWSWMALMSLACVPLVAVASTAADRIAIYFIPLQLVVFSRLPALVKDLPMRTLVVLGVLGGYAAVLFVWLNYATHAFAWIPYNNVVFLPLLK